MSFGLAVVTFLVVLGFLVVATVAFEVVELTGRLVCGLGFGFTVVVVIVVLFVVLVVDGVVVVLCVVVVLTVVVVFGEDVVLTAVTFLPACKDFIY